MHWLQHSNNLIVFYNLSPIQFVIVLHNHFIWVINLQIVYNASHLDGCRELNLKKALRINSIKLHLPLKEEPDWLYYMNAITTTQNCKQMRISRLKFHTSNCGSKFRNQMLSSMQAHVRKGTKSSIQGPMGTVNSRIYHAWKLWLNTNSLFKIKMHDFYKLGNSFCDTYLFPLTMP